MSSTILDKIKAYKLEEIATRKTQTSLATLEDRAAAAPAPRGFAEALRAASSRGNVLFAKSRKPAPPKG